jgi:hypothetical protein
MTNEIIERHAKEFLDSTLFDNYAIEIDSRLEDRVRAELSTHLGRLVAEAYEEAAKAFDERAKSYKRSAELLADATEHGQITLGWHHDGQADAFEDAAYIVRALRDSLVLETSSCVK